MKKIINFTAIAIAATLITGCSMKDVDPNEAKYQIDYVKKGTDYLIVPLQETSAKLVSGAYLLNEEVIPVIMSAGNCKILGEAKSIDQYTANIKISKLSCKIDDKLYESRDTKAWVMKNDYIGVDLNKKELEKRDDQKTSETDNKKVLYGLKPGQEVKIFIEEGTLVPSI